LCDKWPAAWKTKEQGRLDGSVHRGCNTFISYMPTRFPNGGNSTYFGKYLTGVRHRDETFRKIVRAVVSP